MIFLIAHKRECYAPCTATTSIVVVHDVCVTNGKRPLKIAALKEVINFCEEIESADGV